MALLRRRGPGAAAVAALALAGGCTGGGDTDAAPTATSPGETPSITCEPHTLPFSAAVDLTGEWRADDGAIYYVRQIGQTIWWSAMSGLGGPASELGTDFAPVGRGRIVRHRRIDAQWADVPRGRDLNWGDLVFEIVRTPDGSTAIRQRSATTQYDGTEWTPCRSATDGGGPLITCARRMLPFSREVDLTGAWKADDGGIYYIRRIGDAIWWLGMNGLGGPEAQLGHAFTNVGRGRLTARMTIEAEWADVPRGAILGWGTLSLRVAEAPDGSTSIRKHAETPVRGFDASRWTPCTPARP